MFEIFYPSICAKDSLAFPYEEYYTKGYRGIIFDIDNTVALHGEPATKETIELFEKLRSLGFQTCLLSNNKEPRVASFAAQVGADYIFKGGKPKKGGYEKAMKKMNTTTETTFFVGDQLFTDIYGANRVGLYSVLVEPINPKEEIQIVLKRYLEKLVLFFYHRKVKRDGNR